MKFLSATLFLMLITFSGYSQGFKYNRSSKKFVFKNQQGRLDRDKQYDAYRGFHNGACLVMNDDKWGLINEDGEIIIDLEYDDLWVLQDQFRSKLNGKVGLLDATGNELIPHQYEWVESMMNGKAVVKEYGEWKWWIDGNTSGYEEEVEEMDTRLVHEDCIDEDSECTMLLMLRMLYKNIRYPAAARENGIQGTVLVEIIFNESGRIEKKEIKQGLGYGCDEEVMRVFDRFNELNLVPAKKDGQSVRSKMFFPVKFKLE
ncbi:MAG: TonB family protein [Bacteroidota bacterium]